MEQSTFTRRRRAVVRRNRALVVGTAAVLALGAAVAPPASAAFVGIKLAGSNFEIDTDANLKVDGSSPSIDWLSGGAAVKQDKPTGSGDDSMGNGTSENDAVPSVIDGSIPPNKSDLKYFGVLQERSGTASFLHLFWTRVLNPTGTTNMDFEFNKSTTLSSNGVTPVRSAGDLLITYDLSNGGTLATISKRTWTGTVWSAAAALGGSAIGSINTSSITAADSTIGSAVVGPLTSRTFGEASINLASVFDGAACTSFGSAYLKSRSSDSFSAAVKDFIAPLPVSVTNCGEVKVHKQDETGAALAGAVFTLYKNVAPLTAPRGTGDVVTSPALSCTTNAAGDCTISAVPFGDFWVVETTTPPNHDTAVDQAVNVAPGGNTPSGTLTFVDVRQLGSIVVKKVDAVGAPLAGAAFTVTPPATGRAMSEVATGVFCLDNLLYGSYTVTETTVPTGYNGAAPQTVSVSTKSSCATRAPSYAADLTFTNNPAPGTINVLKTDDSATPNALAGAGFTVFSDVGVVGTYEPAVDITVAAGQLLTSAAGTLQFGSVPLGNYCVVETSTPAGYATAPAQCTTIGLGSSAGTGQTVNLSFVDPRQHKVIVIVCHQGTNTLDSSPVTVGASTKSSLAAAPGGFTEAQLCGLGGAAFDGLGHGTTSASVNVQ